MESVPGFFYYYYYYYYYYASGRGVHTTVGVAGGDISVHKEIVHLFLLYIFVFLYKLTELFLDMSDDERINYISKIQLVVYYNYQCCVLIG